MVMPRSAAFHSEQARKAIQIPLCPTALELYVTAKYISELSETADERHPVWARVGHRRSRAEQTDAIDLRWRLGDDRAWPHHCRAAEKGDKFAPLHVPPQNTLCPMPKA
jgi:hypothetical protein